MNPDQYIQIELWQLLSAIGSLGVLAILAVWALAKLLGKQFQKGLDEKFKAQDEAREKGQAEWRSTFEAHEERESKLLSDIEDSLGRHGEQIARLEQDVRHAPSHDDIKQIHKRIDELAADISKLSGQFEGASHTLQLIHQYLLNGSAK